MAKLTKERAHTLPAASDWRTTDEDELLKRRLRAEEEKPRIRNLDPSHPVFSRFEVRSASGMQYEAEIRDVATRQFACSCPDFRINGLGTCKHVEAILLWLGRREKKALRSAEKDGSPRIDVVPDRSAGRLRVERNLAALPPRLRTWFDGDGLQLPDGDPADLAESIALSRSKRLRLSIEVAPWLEARARAEDRLLSRREYETGVASGTHPEHVTRSPLFPYQREGMLHLAFKERALLADEMGLGKTIQAIAASALLHHLGKATRALVVAPASLKSEWEEQITRFTDLPLRLVYGTRTVRAGLYRDPAPPFFTITNYEQIINDSLDINNSLRPDIVILDEAQRIKNWSTKTAQAVKRLTSRYAFVLTGTPIENRIDELRSILDFLDPTILGPLFRFNRQYYKLDDRGRPEGYKNLDDFRRRVAPVILRRRKIDVETELPDRSDRNHFVPLTKAMRQEYSSHEEVVKKLAATAKKRPLTPKEQDILMIELNCMRMVCDTPALMKNATCRDCPKADELAKILDETLADPDVKVIVFSEWTGMLERVRDWAHRNGIGHAWHTGKVPQQKRREEIRAFHADPSCRIFFSTDSGGVGLNLQNASVVINCDLPWNPAKLEQRIARAWRKNQRRAVTVINLVAEQTIEHGMLATLDQKSQLARGVLDADGKLDGIQFRGGRQAMLARLQQAMALAEEGPAPPPRNRLADPALHFAGLARESFGDRLMRCEEALLGESDSPVLFLVIDGLHPGDQRTVQDQFAQVPWQEEPPRLELLDRAQWEAIERLIATGCLKMQARAIRPLPTTGDDARPSLTPEQLARIVELRAFAAKRHKAARMLREDDLPEEADRLIAAAEAAEAEANAIEAGL